MARASKAELERRARLHARAIAAKAERGAVMGRPPLPPEKLREYPAIYLLEELRRRGGTLGAVAEAQLLVARKSQDYNQGAVKMDGDAAIRANRDAYFPFGAASYAHMINLKAQRLISLTLKATFGGQPNFEGIRDTLLDVINYASFWVERIDRQAGEYKPEEAK